MAPLEIAFGAAIAVPALITVQSATGAREIAVAGQLEMLRASGLTGSH
jgi:hypothetical protein